MNLKGYVKGYGFLSFAKNIDRNLGNKYSQKSLDSAKHETKVAKKSTTDPIKSSSKRAIQKPAEATGDLIGTKIAEKLTSVWKELHLKKISQIVLKIVENELEKPKERYISPEKGSKLLMN